MNDPLGKKKKKEKKKEKEKEKEKKIEDEIIEKPAEISPPSNNSKSIPTVSHPQIIPEIQKPTSKLPSQVSPIIVSTPSMPVVIAPVISTPGPSVTVSGDAVSRDDLLSHLLTMGFPESECLAAISSCGLNVDRAITWLCERPNTTPAPAKSKSNIPESKETKKVATGKPPQSPTSTASIVSSLSSPSATNNNQEVDAQLKYQKDKEQKEEQRRINRAWNARVPQQRAEEERKKVLTNK